MPTLSIRLSAMCPIYNGSLILQTARGAHGVTLRSRESRLAGSRTVRAASEQKGNSEHVVERQRVSAELLRCANQ
jgi:hypothetical protein